MGELKEKMLRRMELKNFSQKTIKIYLYHMKKFVLLHGKSPRDLGKEDIETYLQVLVQKKCSTSAIAQAYSSLKFFYSECMERPWELEKIPRPRREMKLPVVLSTDEVKQLLKEVNNKKYKLILMIIYSGGLRLAEALNLKPKDIDSTRMEIRVEQGKGKKDRYTLLSEVVLNKLREYYRENKPIGYLFPGKQGKPINGSTIQRVFGRAKKKPGLLKKQQPTPYAIVLLHIF